MSSNQPNDLVETSRSRGALARGTLSRALLLRIAAIVALACLGLSTLSVVTIAALGKANIDIQLEQALGSPQGGRGPGREGMGQVRVGGLPSGSVAVVADANIRLARVVTHDGQIELTDADPINTLLEPCQTRAHSVDLGDLGKFRTACQQRGFLKLAVAIPLAPVLDMLRDVVLIEGALTLLAVGLAGLLAYLTVNRQLRPLKALSATATEVSRLPLASGSVSLEVRAPDDDSEIGQVGAAFNAMLDHVEEALQARESSEQRVRQFVADASHELRNPLAAIRGYAELASREAASLPENTARSVDRIGAESLRMSKLVEDMLLLARLDNGPEMAISSVDAVETVLNAVDDARVAYPTHRWLLDVPDGGVLVGADAGQLHQIVSNLLSNAGKHTPAGTTVMAAVRQLNQSVEISVTDDGPGIPAELLPHVFERFARADAARTHTDAGSTGLGLSIVDALVKAHGGQVKVFSPVAEGRGTQFVIELPLTGQDLRGS